jgi:hypothetical protein
VHSFFRIRLDNNRAQGDQIGQIFYGASVNFGLLFHGEIYALRVILTKIGWATFRAIFLQAHLVTLIGWKFQTLRGCVNDVPNFCQYFQ